MTPQQLREEIQGGDAVRALANVMNSQPRTPNLEPQR